MKKLNQAAWCMLSLLLVLLCSCDNTLYELLARTNDDPFYDTPQVRSFDRELSISISWKADEGADSYMLRRSIDKTIPDFSTIVYEGEDTSYTDTKLLEGTRYLYRLDKVRGSKTFTGKTSSLGVCSAVKQDFYEDNNTIETATPISAEVHANLYYYPFIDGRVLEDVDWYSIILPPRSIAVFTINEIGISPTEPLTVFFCIRHGFNNTDLPEGSNINVKNETSETAVRYFMIGINKPKFTALYADGTTRPYILKLDKITYQ